MGPICQLLGDCERRFVGGSAFKGHPSWQIHTEMAYSDSRCKGCQRVVVCRQVELLV